MDPITITGVGVLACNGIGKDSFWDALERGVSGIRHIARFDASDLSCQIAGELWDFDPHDFMSKHVVKHWNRHVHQAIAAARLAVEDAGLKHAGYPSERVAVSIGTSIGSPNQVWEEAVKAYESGGFKKINKFASSAFAGHSATVHVSVDLGIKGPATTIASGCATGLDVLAWGMEQLRLNYADVAVVGATEAPIFPMSIAGGCSLGILSKRNDEPEKAMRPFDAYRDGIVLSEGACVFVLEKAGHARARGARIYAEIAGVGAAAEAHSPLILERQGEALARAIRSALQHAGEAPEAVDHIQAHGVSLAMYDHSEVNAYKSVFGDHVYRIPISGVKSMIGQAYSAGGALSVAAALLAIVRGVVPPTINQEQPDPECDLDFVPNRARLNDVACALAVAISFGGTHSAIVLRRYS